MVKGTLKLRAEEFLPPIYIAEEAAGTPTVSFGGGGFRRGAGRRGSIVAQLLDNRFVTKRSGLDKLVGVSLAVHDARSAPKI